MGGIRSILPAEEFLPGFIDRAQGARSVIQPFDFHEKIRVCIYHFKWVTGKIFTMSL